jgi:hypothetical protein
METKWHQLTDRIVSGQAKKHLYFQQRVWTLLERLNGMTAAANGSTMLVMLVFGAYYPFNGPSLDPATICSRVGGERDHILQRQG